MTVTPGCVAHAWMFQHPCVEEDATPASREVASLRARAAAVCGACPLAAQCLYDAVVRHDVAGFVAGTSALDRARLRAALGVRVAPENLDAAACVAAGGRPVDRAEVQRVRRTHPDETLEQLALRLGCSTSTVKRHLRAVRRGTPSVSAPRTPSLAEVLAAARALGAGGVRAA